MKHKTIVITGATAGIGKAASIELAKIGHNLILISRDIQKLNALRMQINQKNPQVTCAVYAADLSSMAEIRKVAQNIQSDYTSIDVLINNAGGVFPEYRRTVDGFEYTFAFNHLSYFLLTGLLLPLLNVSSEPRIINTSSMAHRKEKLDFENIMHTNRFSPMQVYGRSKLANLYFTFQLADMLRETNFTVNALHPGVVSTNFGESMPGIWKLLLPLLRKFFISAEEGAETTVYLADSPDVHEVNGAYFIKKRPVASSDESIKEEPAKQLWALSEQLTGFSYAPVIAGLTKAEIPAGEAIV